MPFELHSPEHIVGLAGGTRGRPQLRHGVSCPGWALRGLRGDER
jgi:hypothetical protein